MENNSTLATPVNIVGGSITIEGDVIVDAVALEAGAAHIGQVSIDAALPAGTAAIGKLAANAGVNIGTVDVATLPALVASSAVIGHVIPDSPAALNFGTETVAVGSAAQQLDTGTSHPCSQVTILCDANAGLIILGAAAGNNIAAGARLQPLCTYVIPISNTNLLWFNGATTALVSANGYTFSWFAS